MESTQAKKIEPSQITIVAEADISNQAASRGVKTKL